MVTKSIRHVVGRNNRAWLTASLRLLILCLLAPVPWASAQRVVPELWGTRIHDEAHVLQQSTIDQLEQQLKAFEDSTTNQVAILLIPSLEGDVLEEYSIRVVERWKLGTEKNDNGVLMLVVVDDHLMRIEVGQGLEGVLTDAQSNRIIRNEMAPAFRRNDFDGGVVAGSDAILRSIAGEYEETDFQLTSGETMLVGAVIFILLAVFTVTSLTTEGCFGWGLYAFLLPFYAALPWIVIGKTGGLILFLAFLVLMPVLKVMLNRSPKWRAKMQQWAGSGGGGSSSGGWSSGSGWSSGRSSGGFSGGGGSFGGGGSSGRW